MNKQEKIIYENATKDYHKELQKLYEKDILFLNNLEKEISPEYFECVKFELEESDNSHNYRFINKPVGKSQYVMEDNYTVYINQHCGCNEDDYYGTVCMKISENKYLIWDYYM